jgi:hypothetical protein
MDSAPNITVLTGYQLSRVTVSSGNVTEIVADSLAQPDEQYQIAAQWFIDSTGDGVLCYLAGCKTRVGEDSYDDFQEPLMKDKTPQRSLNEPSLFFKIAQKPLPDLPSTYDFMRDGYVMDSLEVNPMNGLQLPGTEVIVQGAEQVYQRAKELTPYFWYFLKQHGPLENQYTGEHLDNYSPDSYAPMLGVRETRRIVCDYMLRQQDLIKRINSQQLSDSDYIACGSHTIDFHVLGSINSDDVKAANDQLQPSGIPYHCLLPKALNNVWIACRAYGASHIALAARRVNKDMAQLGWAAGHAARLCLEQKLNSTRKVEVKILQSDDYTGFVNSVKILESKMKPLTSNTRTV